MKRPLQAVLWLFFFLSGATGLLYEIVWMRQLILVFGSTTHAVSAVLSAFMLGLALGSFAFGRISDRGANLVRFYGLLEIGVGLYALVAPFLLSRIAPLFVQAILRDPTPGPLTTGGRFVGAVLTLVPPTILMGGTLPVLSRLFSKPGGDYAGPVGRLYAVNTFGAVLGTLLTGFLLLPAMGVLRTSLVAAGINVALGLLALLFSRSSALAPGSDVQRREERVLPEPARDRGIADRSGAETPSRTLVLSVFALSGCAAMLLEVGWTRVLALTIGSSVYGFTLMLAAFLVGLAGGAAFFARLIERSGRDPARLLVLVLAGAACASWLTATFLGELPYIFVRVYTWTNGSLAWMYAGQMGICLLAMFPATFVMGGIFPLVLRVQAGRGPEIGRPVGEAYAANTLGTVLGAALAGFVLVPTIGVRPTLYVAIGIYLLLAAILAAPRRGAMAGLLPAGAAALASVLFVFSPGWNPRVLNSGAFLSVYKLTPGFTRSRFDEDIVGTDKILYYKEGINANVLVAVDGTDEKTSQLYLKVNGKTDATSQSDLDTQILCGQLPFFYRPQARQVLVIGLGSGVTVASVATHDVATIRVVEMEPAMLGAARCFAKTNRNVLADPRVEIVINDARNDLLLRRETYDIIASEPSNPWMTVASNLFTQDFFLSAREHLSPGGVFAQWVQTYRLSTEDLRSLIATYRSVFPHVLVFATSKGAADLILLGSDSPLPVDYRTFARGSSDLSVALDLRRVRIERPEQILALLLLAAPGLERYVDGAVLNTDDNARIEFSAPRNLLINPEEDNIRAMFPYRIRLPEILVGLPEDPAGRRTLLLDLADALVENERWMSATDALDAADASGQDERSRALRSKIQNHHSQSPPSSS